MNRYNTNTKSCVGQQINGTVRRGTADTANSLQVGSAAAPFTNLYAAEVSAKTVNTTTLNGTFSGPFAATTVDDDFNRVIYSTTGSLVSDGTAQTFSTNAAGEAGLFAIYLSNYSQACIGQYCHTATPLKFIDTAPATFIVSISGAAMKIQYTGSATTIVWKKLKFKA